MLMLNLSLKNSAIILDFTGPEQWLEDDENRQAVEKILEEKKFLLFSDVDFKIPNEKHHYGGWLADNSVPIGHNVAKFIDDLEIGECNIAVITTNKDNIRFWNEERISTIYLTLDNDYSFLDSYRGAPEEIWNINDFQIFSRDGDFHRTYSMEKIGARYDRIMPLSKFSFKQKKWIGFEKIEYDVIFAGRFFTTGDSRQYEHLLSRAILDFKSKLNDYKTIATRNTLLKHFNGLIERVVENIGDISIITAIPPRPAQQHRFSGLPSLYTGSVPLNLDLVQSVKSYPTLKASGTLQERQKVVNGAFKVQTEVSGHILLLDDVYTTGATTSECVKELLKSGASKVTVLPIAHTQSKLPKQYLPAGIINENGEEYQPLFNDVTGENYWGFKWKYVKTIPYVNIVSEYRSQYNIWDAKADKSISFVGGKVKGIIFDLDNTLIETDKLSSKRYQPNYNDEDLRYLEENSTELISAELIKTLRDSGIKVGIVTKSRENYAKTLLKLYNYEYDELITRYSCFRTKPFPDPLISCAKKMRIPFDNILSIGNEQGDLKASREAEIPVYIIENENDLNEINEILDVITTTETL